MKITMRLYRAHDLDLMYMRGLLGKAIATVVKEALDYYVNKENRKRIFVNKTELQTTVIPKNTQFHVYLSDKQDAEIIKWLMTIKKGYRNSMLKNILRSYLTTEYIANAYMHANDITFINGKDVLNAPKSGAKQPRKTDKPKTQPIPPAPNKSRASSDDDADSDPMAAFKRITGQ